jgi:hypothetical protein
MRGSRCVTTQSHRLRMLQHLTRQQLMDQLVRSVQQCERERRARERTRNASRENEYVQATMQKAESDRGKP